MNPTPLSHPHPPASPTPRVSVVVVNYNSWPDVVRLVQALTRTIEVTTGVAEVIVVDNASQGPIPAELQIPTPGVQLVTRTENDGFAAGVNSGWRTARGRWLLVLNPDIIVAQEWLGEVVARIERLEADAAGPPGIVGFALRNPDGSRQPSVGAFPSLPRTVWEQLIPRSRRKYQADWRTRTGVVPWVTGACMLVNTQLLVLLNGMDEDFFLYYEEVALCRSACHAGWRVMFDPSVAATHLRPLQNRALSPKMRVITRHSKLLYFCKHLPRWQFLGLSWIITLEARILGRRSQWTGQIEDARSWRTIHEVARAFRAGVAPRGREVRILAEAVTRSAATSGVESRPTPFAMGSARKRRGVRTP